QFDARTTGEDDTAEFRWMVSVGLLECADGRFPGMSIAHPPDEESDNAATQQHEDEETQERIFHSNSAFAADKLTVAKDIAPQVGFLLVGQPLPNRRSEDRQKLVGQLLR